MAWRGKIGLFKPLIASTLSAGGCYLAQELHRYQQLKDSLQQLPSVINTSDETVEAEHKEWLIFGRQSPAYVRDATKTPKDHLHEKISNSPLKVKALGTHLDNEKHYDLFKGSDFEVQTFTSSQNAPHIIVKPEKMLSTHLHHIEDNDQFVIGFAKKQGFADISQQSPFFHSSIALRKVSSQRPPEPGDVVVTGKEVKQLIDQTNKAICETQHCTLYESNCYSASTYASGKLVELLHQREGDVNKNNNDICAVTAVLAEVAKDNFARGVSNNSVVRAELTLHVPQMLEEHGLLHTTMDYPPEHSSPVG